MYTLAALTIIFAFPLFRCIVGYTNWIKWFSICLLRRYPKHYIFVSISDVGWCAMTVFFFLSSGASLNGGMHTSTRRQTECVCIFILSSFSHTNRCVVKIYVCYMQAWWTPNTHTHTHYGTKQYRRTSRRKQKRDDRHDATQKWIPIFLSITSRMGVSRFLFDSISPGAKDRHNNSYIRSHTHTHERWYPPNSLMYETKWIRFLYSLICLRSLRQMDVELKK